jgi:hypothetical protein
MKKAHALFVTVLLFAVLLSAFTAEASAHEWRDDFNYGTLDELKKAGWTLQNERLISVGGGIVNLAATEQESSAIRYVFSGYSFPSGMSDFSVEIRYHVLDVADGGSCNFSVVTEMHRYSFFCSSTGCDFLVDGELKLPIVQNVTIDWHTLTLEKSGNLLEWYLDGTLEGNETLSNNFRDGLTGMELRSSSSYDYVSVSEVASAPQSQPLRTMTIFVFLTAVGAAVFLFTLAFSRPKRKKKIGKP